MVDIDSLVRENIRRLIPYSCARDEYKGESGIFLDANENPYGTLNRYPDPYQRRLKSAISRIKSVAEGNIFLGNGSDEIIDLCFRAFCNPGKDKALSFMPSYGMYEVSSGINDVRLVKIPLDNDFQIDLQAVEPHLDDPDLKLIFICSPNNPTGNSMDPSRVESIISGFRGIVVIDEAYIDFAGQPSFLTLLDKYNNLIVMQTFSKAMGMAAVRVGMAFMDTSIVNIFNKLKPPYNISSINQNAVLEAIRHNDSVLKKVERIRLERARLERNLKTLDIVEKVYPSDSNFLLVKTKDADLVYSFLAGKGIIVRNRNKMVPGCIRITVGTMRENNALLKTMRQIKI
ncbi:MAG TPA: histidinol-phosphate transaminase [Bacteroidales bacterium]|jgi:histidinol-phosphate aminotransferase|nr:histidinol-phosphate transaminase [Bacteroidales bacterium]